MTVTAGGRIARAALSAHGFYLQTGPFTVRVDTAVPGLLDELAILYDGHPIAAQCDFADFHVTIESSAGLRRWYRPKVQFYVDGETPFLPLPVDQATPMFEWGLNWCLANHPSNLLIIHAAAIEKGGRAMIMPGLPGAGKSTLTAGLVNRGWRLLSDELALISLADGQVYGLARPISLKNTSIEVIREFAPDAIMSRIAPATAKGDVALLRAPADSIARVPEPARPAWVVFPKFMYGLPATLERTSKPQTLIRLAKNSYNYSVHGARGFTLLADVVDASDCYEFTYADLDEAVEIFDRLEPPA